MRVAFVAKESQFSRGLVVKRKRSDDIEEIGKILAVASGLFRDGRKILRRIGPLGFDNAHWPAVNDEEIIASTSLQRDFTQSDSE